MTLTQMQYFEAVCRYENYTKAAAELYVSQPAVSQAVRDLEHELGVKLFVHRGNGLTATEAGRVLLVEIQAVLRQVTHLQETISNVGLSRGFVKIGISTLSGGGVFPKICAAFHKKYPDIQIRSQESDTPTLIQLLNTDSVDLIITAPGSRIKDPEFNKTFLTHPLTTSGLCYCVSREHRWAQRKSVTIEEIAAEPLVMLNDSFASAKAMLRRFQEWGLTPNILLRTGQMYIIERTVECGAAGGFLSKEMVENSHNIVVLHYPEEHPMTETDLVWKRNTILFPSVERFISTAKDVFPHPVSRP